MCGFWARNKEWDKVVEAWTGQGVDTLFWTLESERRHDRNRLVRQSGQGPSCLEVCKHHHGDHRLACSLS